MKLGVPLFSGDYLKLQNFSKKSGSKRLFEECRLPTAPGADEIIDEEDLVNKLTILVAKYTNVNRWVFKVDGEMRGRGIASF